MLSRSTPFISGILISIMIFFNTLLSIKVGSVFSVFIIHLVGFLLLLSSSFIFKWKIKSFFSAPIGLYSGGLLGVFIVYSNNITIQKNGIFLSLGLIIAGQILSSIYFEHKGILSSTRNPFKSIQLPGILLILIGSAFIIY